MTPEQIAEGRRLKAAAEKAWETYVNISGGDEHAEYLEVEKTSEAWEKWRDANIDALLDAAERTEAAEPMRRALAAERELAEAHGDAERFEWWFSSDVDKWNFMPTYFQGIRERWSLSNWRAAIDAERGKR